MKIFRKVFLFQVKVIPVLLLLGWIAGFVNEKTAFSKLKVVSEEEFIKTVLKNNINSFSQHSRYSFIIKLPNGDSYYHDFVDKDGKDRLMETVEGKGHSTYYLSDSFSDVYSVTFMASGILISLLALNSLIFWIVTLVDVLRSKFRDTQVKWIWFIFLILLPFLVPIYYLFFAEEQKQLIPS
jgi:hypothetical protein